MPPNPKRKQSKQPADMLLDDGEVLRADDPRPQHVVQYPSPGTARRSPRRNEEAIPTSVYDTERHDEELAASYDGASMDQSFKPAFLYVERGPGAGQLVQVRQGVMVIGRASVADLRLQHPSISRRHAQLTRRGDKFYVKDLASQNGTFLNKGRVDAELEVSVGDTITLGSAALKLRGPMARTEPPTGKYAAQRERAERVRNVPTAVVTRPGRAAGALKIALFAGAVGFGVAVVVVFGLMRVPAPGFGASRAGDALKAGGAAPAAAKATSRRFQAEPATDEIEISAGPATIMAKRIDDAIEKKMAEQRRAQPAPTPAAEPTRAVTPQPSSEAVAAKKAQPRAARAASSDEAAEAEAPARGAPKKAELLASYEKGDAEASLAAATEAGDKALAAQLQKFVDTYGAAEAAVEKNDARTAISKYEAALKLDDQISSGWSKYGAEIRKKLAGIYSLAGSHFMDAGEDASAKQAFQAALKHDPANAKAKSALAQLGGEAPEIATPPARKAQSKRSAADDAFSDEADEKPAKAAKKPAKASSRSAIDDAFGD